MFLWLKLNENDKNKKKKKLKENKKEKKKYSKLNQQRHLVLQKNYCKPLASSMQLYSAAHTVKPSQSKAS